MTCGSMLQIWTLCGYFGLTVILRSVSCLAPFAQSLRDRSCVIICSTLRKWLRKWLG
ncbi:hypothetical protein BGW80DRAFT_1356166 [Lactifluus volemus]|nr:hypothetical protein BGW80DRAFT_1356166 [Lactifluus volemus]